MDILSKTESKEIYYLIHEKMSDRLEAQLHEQYAKDNNSYFSSIVALFIGMLAALGAYGYVFIFCNTNNNNAINFSPEQLIYASIVACVVLAIIAYLSLYRGVAQRLNQFIVFAIRYKHCDEYNNDSDAESKQKHIFYSGYTPFSKRGLKIVQGLYGELVKISAGLFFLTIASMLFKVVPYIECQADCSLCIALIMTIFMDVMLVVNYIIIRNKQFGKYYSTEKEYDYIKKSL